MFKERMNLRLFDIDANVIDRSGAESLIPTQETNEIIQGTITPVSSAFKRAQIS